MDSTKSEEFVPKISAFISISSCLILSIAYVCSLYVWSGQKDRNHPTTVKKRFISVFIVMTISPIFIYLLIPDELTAKAPIWTIMGFRTKGMHTAIFTSLTLTAILFLGPLTSQALSGALKLYAEPTYWLSSFQNLLWLRNHIVAPLSEEFTFRACMMPLMLQTFQPLTAVLITPLFFGVAHLHHIIERLESGMKLKSVLLVSFFQFGFTTIFGTYSAYLFAKTGHFMAPFIAHAFCNHMGFPDLQDVTNPSNPKRHLLIAIYLLGLISWIILLPIMTEPKWFFNDLYWKM